ncbi:Na(+)-translocating NADH-quinone reductase subunit E [bioreactor metagenome]|uniref:Na(+)-translocating NADH-quinone reductase subunit E n=1 Tax=bioreactor metagenome TaxID=1076179 RepID=A0A645EA32_9ZZZZ
MIRSYGFWQTLLYGIGSGLGWWLAINMLAAIREKMAKTKLPAGMSGTAISFIITGIMAMAFIGFSGIFTIQ